MHSNKYTLIFAFVMTMVVAVSLSLVAVGLQPRQAENMRLDKKMSILAAVTTVDKTNAEELYEQYIEERVIDINGNEVPGARAFDLDLRTEMRKSPENRQLPLYIYNDPSGAQTFIMPVRGLGLWGPIHGFIALGPDFNIIEGAIFSHDKETPGLGDEIVKPWFQDQFEGKRILRDDKYALAVMKGRGNVLDDYHVDGISGATITARGVEDMIRENYLLYQAYFNQVKQQ